MSPTDIVYAVYLRKQEQYLCAARCICARMFCLYFGAKSMNDMSISGCVCCKDPCCNNTILYM